MINTIFRFVQNEAAYEAEKSNIGDRTIVFCHDEGSIWKNNKKYCAAAITNTEIKNLIGSTVSFTPSLTSGTAIGTLRINDATTTLYAPTPSQGGGSSTTTVVVTPLISTGTPIADITVNGSTKRLYAPTSTTPTDPSNPDTPTPSSPTTVRLTEAEFQALLDAGTWEANTLYIIIDAEGKILYMWINGEYIYIAQSSGSNLKSKTITESAWNALTDKDMDTIYVVTDNSGNTIIGLGVSTILTRIPVPASGTTVKLTLAQYDALVAAGTVDASTLYFIVDGNGVILKMYLGTTEVPVGTEAGEAIVKSQITRMFSEKIKWNTDGTKVDSLNWSIIDVDNPGEFYAATGFENLVKNTVKEAGFISKTDNTDNFAEMFATEVGMNSDIVKKASIRAAINNAGDSEVKIQADAVDVDGVFNAHTTNGKTASQLLLEADGISSRVSTVEKNYVKTTNINQTDDTITLEAVYTSGDTSKTASIILGTNENSELTINADNINLNGLTNFITAVGRSIAVANLTAIDGDKKTTISPAIGIKLEIGSSVTNWLKQDGTGILAQGNISWDNTGSISMKNVHVSGSFVSGDSGIRCELVPGSNAGRVRVYDDNVSYATLSTFYGLYGSTGWLKLQKAGGGFLEAEGENISLYNSNTQLRVMIADSADDSGLISIRDANGYSCIITSTGPTTTSDMRLKDIIANKELTVKQIADAPIFTYTSKNNPDANPIIGTSAQYWQEVLPETVSEIDNYLSLDYSRIATASVINLAKHVSKLEEEKSALTLRVEALEARLQLIENNLNS